MLLRQGLISTPVIIGNTSDHMGVDQRGGWGWGWGGSIYMDLLETTRLCSNYITMRKIGNPGMKNITNDIG